MISEILDEFGVPDELREVTRGTRIFKLRLARSASALKALRSEAGMFAHAQSKIHFSPGMPGYVEDKERAALEDHLLAWKLHKVVAEPELSLPDAYQIVLNCGGLAESIIAEFEVLVRDSAALTLITAYERAKKNLSPTSDTGSP